MYFNNSIKEDLTKGTIKYLTELKTHLKNLESLGKSGSVEWWKTVESIDAIENNL